MSEQEEKNKLIVYLFTYAFMRNESNYTWRQHHITPPRFVYITLFEEDIYREIATCEAVVTRVNQHRKINIKSNTTLNLTTILNAINLQVK